MTSVVGRMLGTFYANGEPIALRTRGDPRAPQALPRGSSRGVRSTEASRSHAGQDITAGARILVWGCKGGAPTLAAL